MLLILTRRNQPFTIMSLDKSQSIGNYENIAEVYAFDIYLYFYNNILYIF